MPSQQTTWESVSTCALPRDKDLWRVIIQNPLNERRVKKMPPKHQQYCACWQRGNRCKKLPKHLQVLLIQKLHWQKLWVETKRKWRPSMEGPCRVFWHTNN